MHKIVFLALLGILATPSYYNLQAEATDCTATIDHLINEMTHGRAYIQFHTDDGTDPTNTGPGDLVSPGEIRGDITQDSTNVHMFTATANKDQNVFAHDADQTPWDTVTAMSDLTFTEIGHGTNNHHIEFSFVINPALNNVVGIHMHNGAPGENNPLHLVDFLTDTSSLLTGTEHGPITTLDGTVSGEIHASDVCPTAHSGGHDDGGHDDGGSTGGGHNNNNSTGGGHDDGGSDDGHQEIYEVTTVILAGQVMQPQDYLPLVSYGKDYVAGDLLLRIPCDSDGVPLVVPVAGHIDANPDYTSVQQAHLMLVDHLSTKGKTCLYQSELPADSHSVHHAGSDKITSIGLFNACEKNVVFRTANVMSFTTNSILGQITSDTITNGPIFPSDGDMLIDLHDGSSITGNSCGLFSGDAGGHDDGGHDDGDGHDHGT